VFPYATPDFFEKRQRRGLGIINEIGLGGNCGVRGSAADSVAAGEGVQFKCSAGGPAADPAHDEHT
jgi:hypothetical protein